MIKRGIASVLAILASPTAAEPIAAPTPPSIAGRYEMRIRLVPKADRVPVALERINGVMVFPIELNGERVWALVDNGMPVSLIDERLARDLKIPLSEPTKPLLTPSGQMEQRRAEPVEFVLPGMARIVSPLSAVDLSLASRAVERPVALMIGADLLRGMALYVRNSDKTLEVAPSRSARLPAGIRSVPLRGRFHQLAMVLNGVGLTLSLDLGYNGDLSLTPAAWSKIPKLSAAGTSRSANLDGRWQSQVYGMSDTVQLAGVDLRNVKIARFAPGKRINDEANSDGHLGAALLSRFDFLLDLSAGSLHLIEWPGTRLSPGHIVGPSPN